MWTTVCLDDPISHRASSDKQYFLVHSKASIASILVSSSSGGNNAEENNNVLMALQQGERPARVALADFCSRTLADGFRKNLLLNTSSSTMAEEDGFGCCLALEPLEFVVGAGGGRRNKKQSNFTSSLTPYILERTDVWSTENNEIHVMMRAKVVTPKRDSSCDNNNNNNMDGKQLEQVTDALLTRCLGLGTPTFVTEAMNHVACAVVQEKLRQCVAKLDAVAFIADGSILPRKSGANNAPMASPPAVPCQAPTDSTMKQTLQIDLGLLRPFLVTSIVDKNKNKNEKTTTLSITGMIIPKGITLIAGGGYHGKVRERFSFVRYHCVCIVDRMETTNGY
jgi:Predicted ATPase of the ABC class